MGEQFFGLLLHRIRAEFHGLSMLEQLWMHGGMKGGGKASLSGKNLKTGYISIFQVRSDSLKVIISLF